MDHEPRGADDLPDDSDLPGLVRDAVEQIRGDEPSDAMLARVLQRARQIAAAPPTAAAPLPADPAVQSGGGLEPALPDSPPSPSDKPSPRRNRMLTFALRGLAAATATTTLIAAWLYHQASSTVAADLGSVLTRTSAAESMQLQVTRDGQNGEVWVHGRKLRRNLPDGTYQITRDGQSWLVDEKANLARRQGTSFFSPEAGGVDLLALLDVPPERLGDRQKELLMIRPAEHATRDGRVLDIYRWENAAAEDGLRIEAVVDAKTQLLLSIESLRIRGERTEPICKLAVIARDNPVDEELFVVGATLTEDGRIGKVTDAQGLAAIRPAMYERFSPLIECMPLRPGDLLQTDPRGANAITLRLVPQTEVLIGPGSTVELASPKQIRMAEGEIRIKAEDKSPIELVGPDGKRITVTGTQVFRADRQTLVKLAKPPRWLLSYEGKVAGDSIGSLLAKIDGRNVPLSVGYHKVTVDIRDQIARTTIEESFVNHTNAQLEGTFFFPLPQDASIAGFGMWIGDQLVEADVVEKERAREIYETMLRERRDPGLLEWSGGNIFKARVFPIPAQAEKRITITYTQVLPLRGNSYRYQYALQSELLKQHPLRQLEIDLKINSAQRLKAISSPTHLTRNTLTPHSGHVEFSAKEYTPTQDFETLVELQEQQSNVLLIPHRRGDDGYFILQLMPPSSPLPPAVLGRRGEGQGGRNQAPGQLQRELLPNSEPIELILLADTSASMDAPSRQRQAELVAALLTALTPKDKFNLGTCDVDCQWVFAKAAAAEAKNVERARQMLAARRSLGWTDLDKALQSTLAQCGPKTQVVYIGDGIVTTGDADPLAFVKRLRRVVEQRTPHAPRDAGASKSPQTEREECGTFHCVALGSSFEPGVMKAIASIGGGSFRQVSGSHGPAAVAMELLGEITQPVLRDLRIEFRGLRTARVYPEPLPNLAEGTQQIVLGRYAPQGPDPTSKPQTGEVIVSGTLDGKPVQYSAQVSLGDVDQGNSFIPRLWARMHLDALLEQGASPAIKDEIIALSEEFHIITPYTSLLVLETDADRERFGVKRRFQMRDGEKFFAAGRENSNWELIQQQMKQAGAWRLGLRREVLQQFSHLGRDIPVIQAEPPSRGEYGRMGGAMGGFGGGIAGRGLLIANGGGFFDLNGSNRYVGATSISAGSMLLGDLGWSESHEFDGVNRLGLESNDHSGAGDVSMFWDRPLNPEYAIPMSWDVATTSPVSRSENPEPLGGEGEDQDADRKDLATRDRFITSDVVDIGEIESTGLGQEGEGFDAEFSISVIRPIGGRGMVSSFSRLGGMANKSSPLGASTFGGGINDISGGLLYLNAPGADYSWLNNLFAPLPPPPVKPPEPKQPWPAEARQIARSLLRTEHLTGIKEGLRIETQSESFDARWDALTSRSQTTALVAPHAWLSISSGDGSQTSLSWADARQRGSLAGAMLLGRVRASRPADLQHPPLEVGAGANSPLDLSYPGYSVQLNLEGEHQSLLTLKHPSLPQDEIRILVDTTRHVIAKIEYSNKGRITSTTNFGDFVEIAAAWYAGRIESIDSDGRRTSITKQKFTALAGGEFDRQWKQNLAIREQAQLLSEPLPRLRDAKRALAAGNATFEDQMVMLLHFQATQQWDRVLGYLADAERLSGKPGMRWVRMSLLPIARKAEEAKRRFLEEAESLAKQAKPPADGNDVCLADYLFNNSGGILEANEQLRLLDALRPIYERQPAHVVAMKRWNESRCNLLERNGQSQEVLKLRQQLAADSPHDYSLQQQCARALANVGDYQAAYAWLDRRLVPASKWLPYEEEYLVTTYCDLLEQQGRYDDLLEYLSAWVKRDPPAQSIYAFYLTALVRSDHVTQADDRTAQWIRDAEQAIQAPPRAENADHELPADVDARLRAAVAQALGRPGYNDRIEPRWLTPLADAALCFARHPWAASMADQIMGQYNFQQSDACRRVRKAALRMLLEETDKLPVDALQRLVNWISANDPAVEKEAWRKISAGLRGRWEAEPNWQVKHQLGGMLAGVLRNHIDAESWIAFLRRQLKDSPDEQHAGHARLLFDALLSRPWKPQYEDEAFGLLAQLPAAEQPSQRLAAEVAALCRMTDCLVRARFQARMKAVEHPEKLTRTELGAKQAENLRLAREGYADRLHKEMAGPSGRLLPWINIERLYLDVQTGRNLDKIAEECFALLPACPNARPAAGRSFFPERTDVPRPAEQGGVLHQAPTPLAPSGKSDLPAENGETDEAAQQLDALLQHRGLMTLMNLAARKGAKAGLAERVLAYLEAGDKADPENRRWKALQYEFLVALDRPKDLVPRLQAWIAADDADNGWRRILGYLQAESGQISAAIRLFEAVRTCDELSGADYRTLADWYMAVNRRDAYEQARIATFKVIEEWRLNQWLWTQLQPWQRSNDRQPPPRELDVEVLHAFTAIFEKASQPQGYVNQLNQFYAATRDFRLLAGLADAILGHTAGQVYPFVAGMSGVLAEVRDEATADSIVERIAAARGRAKTEVDRRALDLLEMMVERRAAEIQNQAGPHVQRALAAMQRAWKRQWSAGEPRLVAELLASLGHVSQQPLSDCQVAQLESLHRDAASGTVDRLKIGAALAQTYWAYSRFDAAIDRLTESLDEYQAACGGSLPASINGELGELITYLESRTQHARGEKAVQEQLKHAVNQQQTYWLTERLYQLYDNAIANDGDVSLGRGAELYRLAEKKLRQDLDTPDQNHRYNLVNRLNAIYRTARNKQLPGVADNLRHFAFRRLPEILKRQTNNYGSMVSETASVLHDIAGPLDALKFLAERIDAEPDWLRLNNQNLWNEFCLIGQWRTEVKDLGGVEKPLLAIVLKELRSDLQSRQQRNRIIFMKHNNYYWSEKEADFARTADEVWAQEKQSGAACRYIAEYLYSGLDHYPRAIEILLDAHRREVLDEGGQSRLVEFLRWQNRFAETIPILDPLVQRRSGNLQYRVWLMNAYFKTGKSEPLAKFLKETHDFFHKDGRWNEPAMAMLGRSCLENEIYRPAVDYLAEAIALHQRTARRRGIGDGTLSGYYGDQARAFAGLKQTPEAVDAAAAAVVAWGSDVNNRNNALEALRAVLRAAGDLDAYVVRLDKQAAETRQENPILRKAIGQVYREQERFGKAITQLLIAAEVQPNDAETHQALLACYDRLNDHEGAVEQLLAWRQLTPRDINLYDDLGRRLEKLGQGAEVERAYTSIVEALPAESESHQLLAGIRQRQERWSDAADQWRQVARIRSLEPAGLLGLTEALIHQRQFAEAAKVLQQLKQKNWPARFENWPTNLRGKISELEQKLEQARKAR